MNKEDLRFMFIRGMSKREIASLSGVNKNTLKVALKFLSNKKVIHKIALLMLSRGKSINKTANVLKLTESSVRLLKYRRTLKSKGPFNVHVKLPNKIKIFKVIRSS